MSINKQRVENQLRTFAHVIGGTDGKGTVHTITPEQQRNELFWIKYLHNHHAAGTFCLGDVIKDKIREDCYQIEHIGNLTQWQSDTFQKAFTEYLTLHKSQLVEGSKHRNTRHGLPENTGRPLRPLTKTNPYLLKK